MKPKPAIYQAATKALNIPPEHCVFVDDLLPNCEGARQLGWKVIHLQPHTDLRAELKGFGLKGLND
jgi:FMN phosphatase YigB (HAD superfamily)